MHKALSLHVREQFLSRGSVSSVRSDMVASAVEVSLRYPPIPKGKIKPSESARSVKSHSDVPAVNGEVDEEGIENKKKTKIKKKKKHVQIVAPYVVKEVNMI